MSPEGTIGRMLFTYSGETYLPNLALGQSPIWVIQNFILDRQISRNTKEGPVCVWHNRHVPEFLIIRKCHADQRTRQVTCPCQFTHPGCCYPAPSNRSMHHNSAVHIMTLSNASQFEATKNSHATRKTKRTRYAAC